MRLKILALLASVVSISACAQDQDISSGSSGTGTVSSTTGSSSGSGTSAGVGSSALKPGSKEEFIAEVGDRVFFGYDKSANQFAFITGATNTSEVFSGTDGALRAGSLNLTGSGLSKTFKIDSFAGTV